MFRKPQRRIVAVYLLVATLWILFSDAALYSLGVDHELLSRLSMVKGLAYVAVTGSILYLHLRREFNQRLRLEAELREQVKQVSASREALQESERRFRTAVIEAPQPMMIYAEDGEVLAISRRWLEISGYEAAQLTTLDAWMELAYGSGKGPVREHVDTLFDLTKRVDEGDYTVRCADGRQRVWEFSSTPLGRLPDQRRVVVTMASDVTERRQAEQAEREYSLLTARYQKEHERNQLIQRIIGALSHDLRTPLTVIATARESMTYFFESMSPEKRQEKLDTIGRQVQYALELLDDTVNMARGDFSEAPLHVSSINLAALCAVSVDELRLAKGATHQMVFINRSELQTVQADEVLITRILLNLLSNAVKYSPAGSEVRLELDSREGWILLRVIDQGMGISEKDLPHVFEPFYRSEQVGRVKGTGLGLSIVRDCVERHQGRVSVESKPGQGSTFTVEIPLRLSALTGEPT